MLVPRQVFVRPVLKKPGYGDDTLPMLYLTTPRKTCLSLCCGSI